MVNNLFRQIIISFLHYFFYIIIHPGEGLHLYLHFIFNEKSLIVDYNFSVKIWLAISEAVFL